MIRPYNDYTAYLHEVFGERVQKISLDAGFTCPNRDGTKGRYGCSYCNMNTLAKAGSSGKSISAQLRQGIEFFQRRNGTKKFLAYFQSYTNTYSNLATLRQLYEEALQFDAVAGLVIGTRPDCISPAIAEYLKELSLKTYVSVELGIESTDEVTLRRVNRCHTFEDAAKGVYLLQSKNLFVGTHLILGFPWESQNTLLSHADRLSILPIQAIKLHHLQILRHTMLASEHKRSPYKLSTPEEYLETVINFLRRTRSDIVIQRFLSETPFKFLVAPKWKIKNNEFTHLLRRTMTDRGIRQGDQCERSPLQKQTMN